MEKHLAGDDPVLQTFCFVITKHFVWLLANIVGEELLIILHYCLQGDFSVSFLQ